MTVTVRVCLTVSLVVDVCDNSSQFCFYATSVRQTADVCLTVILSDVSIVCRYQRDTSILNSVLLSDCQNMPDSWLTLRYVICRGTLVLDPVLLLDCQNESDCLTD